MTIRLTLIALKTSLFRKTQFHLNKLIMKNSQAYRMCKTMLSFLLFNWKKVKSVLPKETYKKRMK